MDTTDRITFFANAPIISDGNKDSRLNAKNRTKG